MKATITKVETKGYYIKKVGKYFAVIANSDKSVSSYEMTMADAEKRIKEFTEYGF